MVSGLHLNRNGGRHSRIHSWLEVHYLVVLAHTGASLAAQIRHGAGIHATVVVVVVVLVRWELSPRIRHRNRIQHYRSVHHRIGSSDHRRHDRRSPGCSSHLALGSANLEPEEGIDYPGGRAGVSVPDVADTLPDECVRRAPSRCTGNRGYSPPVDLAGQRQVAPQNMRACAHTRPDRVGSELQSTNSVSPYHRNSVYRERKRQNALQQGYAWKREHTI